MTNDFLLLLPLIVLGAGAIALMVSSAYKQFTNTLAAYVTAGIFAFAFLLQLGSCVTGNAVLFSETFSGILVVSTFSLAAGMIICACGFFTSLSSQSYFQRNNFCTPEFYSLTLFAAAGMLLLTMSQELVTAFIALEIMSLAIYVLVGYNRNSVISTEAVLKYLILGAFAGAFFAMGTALIYGGAASTKFTAISQYIGQSESLPPAIIGGAFFILATFFFKAAAFPFHAWVIDVYDGASVPVTGYMATGLKTAIFAVFANFLVLNDNMHAGWVTCLFYISIFTMFAGNFIAIGQQSLKRMLAASGIVHSGYLLIALVAINNKDLNSGSIIAFYLAAYAVATLGMFAALSYLTGTDEKRKTFEDFKGLAKKRPFSAAAISIFLLSMAGIPPTAGFLGKFYIITTAIDAGQIMLAVLGIISSIVSMWYYLRLIINMYFYQPSEEFSDTFPACSASVCTFTLAICVFALGLYPLVI